MEYKFPKDFITRTLFNLGFIEEMKNDKGPYEVTQQVNSLLGLLIVPKELDPIMQDKRKKLRKQLLDLKLPDDLLSEDADKVKFMSYIWHLRNSFAHGRFNQVTTDKEISGFCVFDIYPNGTTSMVCHQLDLDQLEDIVFKYLKIAYEVNCEEEKELGSESAKKHLKSN
ncbi:hypothetical protein KAU45_08120 [bacterium]|nr:hypothetical protein [bacterium]